MGYEIPKIIHYCWFGGKELPDSARRCIESWKRYCPGYEIKEWNEGNYDINACDYAKGACEAGKWAFLSDYARFDILSRYGGIYFDTDVELVRPIDDIVEKGPFLGMEKAVTADGKHVCIGIAAGLGIGTYVGNAVIDQIKEDYEKESFNDFGIQKTVVSRVTDIFVRKGFICEDRMQEIEGVSIYPSEYFCPMDNMTGKLTITDNTRSIHHYDATWMKTSGKISIRISRAFAGTGKLGHTVGTALSIPFRLANKLR